MTKTVEFRSSGVHDLPKLADKLVVLLPERGVVMFEGEMGAGKTTLIKHLCAILGVTDDVSSPTYALVNEYHTETGRVIYHFDLYRLEHPEEVLDIGIEEYFSDRALSFIEWPDRLGVFAPEDAIRIKVVDTGTERVISLTL